MPIKTIEEVITRIIAINTDLNEASLNSLLVASGWENADIDNGINIFRRSSQRLLADIPSRELDTNVTERSLSSELIPQTLSKIEETQIREEAGKEENEIVIKNIDQQEIDQQEGEVIKNKSTYISLAANILLIALLIILGLYLFRFRLG